MEAVRIPKEVERPATMTTSEMVVVEETPRQAEDRLNEECVGIGECPEDQLVRRGIPRYQPH